MKAAVVEKPGVLVVKDVPVPPMGDYDVLCEMLYGATCSGTDLHLIHNRFPWGCKYPAILGHESIGRATKLGPKVRHLKVGDLITRVGTRAVPGYEIAWGGFAEFGLARDYRAMKEDGCPLAEWDGNRVNQTLPAGTDPAAATMVITWRETLSYVSRMGIGAGAQVLVIGSGGNGLAVAAHARNLGAASVAMLGNETRRKAAAAVGVKLYVDYHAKDPAAALAKERPDGFDFLVDVVGKAGSVDPFLGTLKSGGTVSIYGIDEFGACALHPQKARGPFRFFPASYDEEEAHGRVVAFMREKKLDARVWMDLQHPVPLEKIADAFKAIESRQAIKVLVKLSADR
jgi:D-arabinose 1-dehydrogenase-like Zn-dependent alcohol dehydrogenase